MTKLPSIQWYPGDWRKDPGVQSLDYESRGVWFEILMLMFESENRGELILNGVPMPDDALAQILGLTTFKIKQILNKLVAHGVASRNQTTGTLYCRRLLRDEDLRKVRASCGSLGGSKKQANRVAFSTPSSSTSSSTSSSSSKKHQQGGALKKVEELTKKAIAKNYHSSSDSDFVNNKYTESLGVAQNDPKVHHPEHVLLSRAERKML